MLFVLIAITVLKGLIYYDPNFNETTFYGLMLTKRYSVLRHFTKAAPVGAVRRNVAGGDGPSESSWRILAFDYASSCQPFAECDQPVYSVVAMNAQWNASSVTIVGHITTPSAAFRTSVTEDWVEVDVPVLGEDGSLTVEAPEMSIYTIFF